MKVLNIPKHVNGTVVRIVAGQVFLLSISILLTGSSLLIIIMAMDFLIRTLGYSGFSPLSQAGAFLAKRLRLKKKIIFFKPKRFAALIGFSLSLSALILLTAGQTHIALGFISVLGVFSFLEAFLGFCAGCKIYGFLITRGLISSRNCPDCVS